MSAVGAAILAVLAQARAALVPADPTVNTFNASGTWTKPAGAKQVRVQMWGGGGGGSGRANTPGGGGGGAYYERLFDESELTATVAVTVGAGGAGGTGTAGSSGTVGSDGGDSTFGAYGTAYAGRGGTMSDSGFCGAGGLNTPLDTNSDYNPSGPATLWSGGSGGQRGNNSWPQSSTYGGGGGASYRTGVNMDPGVSLLGGNGGATVATSNANGAGSPGVAPGGGGGSGAATTSTTYTISGGAGAAGRVVVTTYYDRSADRR